MFRRLTPSVILAIALLLQTNAFGQGTPIAVGTDSTFGGASAFDGTNLLVTIMGDSLSPYSTTAQLVSPGFGPVGSRIRIGTTGGLPSVAFDGTNYLVLWSDAFQNLWTDHSFRTGDVHGQFISTSGALVGHPFLILSGVDIRFGMGRGGVYFAGSSYLVTYASGTDKACCIYGRRVSTSGSLLGSAFQISSMYARDQAAAFDGTNFLIVWCEDVTDNTIYGQFVSPDGSLVRNNVVIDASLNASDNPVAVAFGDKRYLVAFHDQSVNGHDWDLLGHYVSPTGNVAPMTVHICDSTTHPKGPSLAFDGTNFLLAWLEGATMTETRLRARFFTTSGAPLDTPFTVFAPLGGKFPYGGVGMFVNGKYVLGATEVDTNFSDGDVYGRGVDPLTKGANPLLGTWERESGPSDVVTVYYNSNIVYTNWYPGDSCFTGWYTLDSIAVPHRIIWHARDRIGNLGIWRIDGNHLDVKGGGGDTVNYPGSFDPEPLFDWSSTRYVRTNPLTGVSADRMAIPEQFILEQNYPNPFNPLTKIRFQMAARTHVRLALFDVLGREVALLLDDDVNPGWRSVTVDGANLASGMYFYRLQAGESSQTRKLVLIK